MELSDSELKEFLDLKYQEYNQVEFIESDPISIPHLFTSRSDIEIAAFFAATLAWGKRSMILKSCNRLMDLMDHAPYQFIMEHEASDLAKVEGSIYRTFNNIDYIYFITALKNIYSNHGGLEKVFTDQYNYSNSIKDSIIKFRKVFFELEHPDRTGKHVANPERGSASKRINMFLRWMVRSDNNSVDFGIWKDIRSKDLLMPLDVHSGNVGRKLGLLNRKQNDWRAVQELTDRLKEFDSDDPVKYDFALFGLGVFEQFK